MNPSFFYLKRTVDNYDYDALIIPFKTRVLADSGTYTNETALRAFLPTLNIPNTTLALYPSSYKAGKIYSVLPNTSGGDATVTRATTKTRINKDGYIEVMPANVLAPDYTTEEGIIRVDKQATNLVQYSKDLSQWYKPQIGNIIEHPSSVFLGETTSYKLVESNGMNYQRTRIIPTTPLVTGSRYTAFFIAKSAERRYAQFFVGSTFVNFDLQDGVISRNFGLESYSVSRLLANGFRKYTMTFIATSTSSEVSIGCILDANAVRLSQYIGDGVSGIIVNAVQLSLEDVPFIETSGTAKTVNKDLVTITPPALTTKITTELDNGTITETTTIPASYELPAGRYKSIKMIK